MENQIFKVHLSPPNQKGPPPLHKLALDKDPNVYYAGAQTFQFMVGPHEDLEMERRIAKADFWPRPQKHHYQDAESFVDRVLTKPDALVMKMAVAASPKAQTVVLMVHAIDLDADFPDKAAKQKLRERLFKEGEAAVTIGQLIQDYPDSFGQCLKDAQMLIEAAEACGKTAICISTGFKGFRILITDPDPSLYIVTERSSIKGSAAAVKDLVQPVLAAFFGFSRDTLPSTIDYSVWGESKGVRTNLHPHPATGLGPTLVGAALDKPYGHSGQPDPAVMNAIRQFWIQCLARASAPPGSDEEKQKKPKKKKKKALPRKRGRPKKDDNGNDDPDVAYDNFDDILLLLATKGWVPQQSSMSQLKKGEMFVQVYIDRRQSAKQWTCLKTKRVHDSNTFIVTVDRVTGRLKIACADPECNDPDYPWPSQSVVGTLSDEPLFRALHFGNKKQGPMSNHADIGRAIAVSVSQLMAYDHSRTDACKWRIYKKETGTWHPCSTAGQFRYFIRQVLVENLEALADMALSVQKSLPSQSKARNTAAALEETLRTNCVHLSGASAYMAALASAMEAHCIVPQEKWQSHVSGYLPVANVLLHFSTTTGKVAGLPYRPDMYICHEYQSPLLWNDDGPSCHQGLETLLDSWWDSEDRKAWLQFIAYGLSRTAFAEKLFVLYGPPGSAKSSLFKILGKWFQSTNVFAMPGACFLVQANKTSKHDDDGKGHDSTRLSMCDKAIVMLPEPPVGGYFRDHIVKSLTGDQQSGRRAHSADVVNINRTFTPAVVCNSIPRPINPEDDAMVGRIEILTSRRVFYRSETNRESLEAKMTEAQLKDCTMVHADSTVVDAVVDDLTNAGPWFLHLVAVAWHELIVDQQRKFYTSPFAKTVTEAYWKTDCAEGDSVRTFLSQQVVRKAEAVLPKHSLWLAYGAWYAAFTDLNGSPGTLIQSEQSFKDRVKRYYSHSGLQDARRKVPVMEKELSNNNNFNESAPRLLLNLQNLKDKVHCYIGLKLKPFNNAYPSY